MGKSDTILIDIIKIRWTKDSQKSVEINLLLVEWVDFMQISRSTDKSVDVGRSVLYAHYVTIPKKQ